MWVAAGTPPAIVQAIQQTVAKVLADPAVRERILSFSQEPVGNSPAEFAAQFKSEMEKFAKVVETAKIPKMD
jgi:tripartite-type tricarboxylate transporter receptor subunit TctC